MKRIITIFVALLVTVNVFAQSPENITEADTTNWNSKSNQLTAGNNITIVGDPINAEGATSYSVGDFAHGGIVFWVDETGQHGLVCAKEDQGDGVRWHAGTFGSTQAKGSGPYEGEANTSIIIAAHVTIGDDGDVYAARICNELEITEGGKKYDDWYLPSRKEFYLIYKNRETIEATAKANSGSGFAGLYWSSTERNATLAYCFNFASGFASVSGKPITHSVRAVRAF